MSDAAETEQINDINVTTIEPLNDTNAYAYVKGFPTNEGKIGAFVWNDLDADGIYDPTEPGVNGITVELYDGTGISLIASVVTANNADNRPGYYQFTGLEAGTYMVKFIPPAGYVLSIQNVNENGSKPDPATCLSHVITLSRAGTDNTINAGICAPPASNNAPDSSETGNNGDTPGKNTASPYAQAVSDLIESVALQQTGIAHIMNAEGEKLQKALALTSNRYEIIQVNHSVERVLNAIGNLEMILTAKLITAGCKICTPFHV